MVLEGAHLRGYYIDRHFSAFVFRKGRTTFLQQQLHNVRAAQEGRDVQRRVLVAEIIQALASSPNSPSVGSVTTGSDPLGSVASSGVGV